MRYEEGAVPKLPKGTWLLVDSNRRLTDVPEATTNICSACDGFILQAASPRRDRLDWRSKYMPIRLFWMAPWSLEELIAA